jgi:hypothetical protein
MGSTQYQNCIDLLQGTLDMLILQILQGGPSTAMASCRLYIRGRQASCRWRQVGSPQRCIAWSDKAGSAPSGSRPRAGSVPGTIAPRRGGKSSWPPI